MVRFFRIVILGRDLKSIGEKRSVHSMIVLLLPLCAFAIATGEDAKAPGGALQAAWCFLMEVWCYPYASLSPLFHFQAVKQGLWQCMQVSAGSEAP